MIDCAYNEIGKHLGMPTQAYISLSDSKQLDAQSGLESSMGATLAALSGINNISGPGMLDFESCQSLEKLVLDNEICGMTLRMIKGIEPKEDFPSLPRFEELLKEKHLLISKHTLRYLKEEFYFPGQIIDRASRTRWQEEGGVSLLERAHNKVEKLIKDYVPSELPDSTKKDLKKLMEEEARRYGMESLPQITL
jgi:trimethylamine--corrinoid protein Co-methyltransferase